MKRILLVDNGSLRPQATLNLRRLAGALAQATRGRWAASRPCTP